MKLSELKGIGEVTEKKLADFGIIDVTQLLIHSPREISDITGMDSESAANLFIKARKTLEEDSVIGKRIQSGIDIKKQREEAKKVSTGCKALDKLFMGGVEAGATTEVYGEFGSGKSQFCHTMAVRVQFPESKGGLSSEKELDAKVCWIDTEDTFRPERIEDIAKTVGIIDTELILRNILVARVHNTVEQRLALEDFEKMIKKENIKLIIVDSTVGLFRAEYIGRGSLSDRQGQLNRFVDLASHISRFYQIPVIFTNQVLADPGQMFGDPTKPIGGNVIGHTSTYRVYFKKSGKNRVARMVDSPSHPDTEVMFALSKGGIVDLETKELEEKKNKKLIKEEKI